MDVLVPIVIGVCLAAACGLRVFVPMLALGLAAKAGMVALSPQLGWLSSDAGLLMLLVATVVEVAAYKVPWLDHALDVIASPAAVLAGTLVAASQIGAVQWGGSGAGAGAGAGVMQWALALVAGGVPAAAVQTASVSVRGMSTAATAGIANPIISAGESILAVILSVLSILVPVVAAVLLVVVVVVVWRVTVLVIRHRRGDGQSTERCKDLEMHPRGGGRGLTVARAR